MNSNLVIMNEKFKKENSEQEVDGLTIIVDGAIKQIFDRFKELKGYDEYNEVLRDVIVEGINKIINDYN